jgi:hypothetical protein
VRLPPEAENELVELASGVDALYLSGDTELPNSLIAELDEARGRAADAGEAIPFRFGGGDWHLAGHGWLKYRYCLANELGKLGITPGRRLPALRFQPRAPLLHGLGPHAAVEWIDDAATSECGDVSWSVNRLDVFSDWQHWKPTGDDRHRFVCRAGERATYESNEQLTGFTLGKRKTGTVMGRIYDKPKDIQLKGSDYWFERWGDRYQAGASVMRVELEFGREGLRQFGLSRPTDVLAAVGDLWDYGTCKWLTYRTPTSDKTKSRWPVAEEWQRIQRASFLEDRLGVERVVAGKRAGGLRRLLPALTGYLASAAALLDVEAIDAALDAVAPHLADYALSTGVPFHERVRRKRHDRAA